MIGGVVLVALFVLRQYRLSTPLLNFAVFKINNLQLVSLLWVSQWYR